MEMPPSDFALVLGNIRRRARKHVRGLIRTALRKPQPYSQSYWDDEFYDTVEHESQTISVTSNALTTAYHYSTTEAVVVRALARYKVQAPANLLDVGSGTGHWTSFFVELYPDVKHADLFDVSAKSCYYLTNKFDDDERVQVYNQAVNNLPPGRRYDIACLIGCAFHIVDDKEMERVLKLISQSLSANGVILLNDLLPWASYVSQFTRDGKAVKRVRSKRCWRTFANRCCLSVQFLRNHAWVCAPGSVPENHLVCLRKRACDTAENST